MILFALRCSHGHGFEAWFRDGVSYDQQAAAGAITCAICGDQGVSKALMAPAVGRRSPRREGDQGERAPPAEAATSGARPGPPAERPKLDPERVAAAMRGWRQVQAHIEQNFDHVGPRFAEEARKMHYGEADKRSIYGEASTAEAKELHDEGIQVGQIPWLPRHDG